MNIGMSSRRPARAGATQGTARVLATAVLVTAACGTGHLAPGTTAGMGTGAGMARAAAVETSPRELPAAPHEPPFTTAQPQTRPPLTTAQAQTRPPLTTAQAQTRPPLTAAQAQTRPPLTAVNTAGSAGNDEQLVGAAGAVSVVGGKPVDCRRAKCVALTFDDGPGPYTDALLRHLAAYRAKATFFVVGRNVVARPEVVRRAYRAGHEIGSHTWSHPDLTRLSPARVRYQLARADRAVKAAIGVTPKLVRPPYGALNASVRRQTKRPMVLWNVDTLDWRHRNSAKVARKTIASVRPGSIILFHDIHPSTVRAIPRVLRTLSKRGYTFVTVTRLFGGKPPRIVHSGGLLSLT
ncbi:hypothetical protein GCM10022224_043780 [Nonomuraea antimicrobica]|uniref:NodB homology domain-containing protein n=1 Tax=Nonomuraea antimicrobica TaxID=561173 RepID=A0ABP7BZT5_9ACTN